MGENVMFIEYLLCDKPCGRGVHKHHLVHSSLPGGSSEKMKFEQVSKGAWNRKQKENRFEVKSGNRSQILFSPAVIFAPVT